jgi:hypothetical protein
MAVLWYAIGIYMIGIAVVLYFRPRTMFREDGMWKEFGLSTAEERNTIFPFWMFALTWAILSYALANLLSLFFASVVLNSSSSSSVNGVEPINSSFLKPISANPNANLPPPTFAPPVSMAVPAIAPKIPGYYILDPYASPAQPRYIYYGMEPPGKV